MRVYPQRVYVQLVEQVQSDKDCRIVFVFIVGRSITGVQHRLGGRRHQAKRQRRKKRQRRSGIAPVIPAAVVVDERHFGRHRWVAAPSWPFQPNDRLEHVEPPQQQTHVLPLSKQHLIAIDRFCHEVLEVHSTVNSKAVPVVVVQRKFAPFDGFDGAVGLDPIQPRCGSRKQFPEMRNAAAVLHFVPRAAAPAASCCQLPARGRWTGRSHDRSPLACRLSVQPRA